MYNAVTKAIIDGKWSKYQAKEDTLAADKLLIIFSITITKKKKN